MKRSGTGSGKTSWGAQSLLRRDDGFSGARGKGRAMDGGDISPWEGLRLAVFVAARGFEDILLEELGRLSVRVLEVRERLVLAEAPEGDVPLPMWAQNVWLNPRFIRAESIGGFARALTALQRNWHLHSTGFHRRAALIAEKCPHVSERPLRFGEPAPASPLGSWTLWAPDAALASPACSSPFPDGEVRFEEDKINPPSRAYLKLWELFTRFPEAKPAPGDLCLDLGACPGGWTWVLASLGAKVFALDKAPLDGRVAAMPGVTSCIGSGFGLDPRHAGSVDWLFSDMICYPSRLYEVIMRWEALGECKNFVCTLKCQGQTDFDVLERFASLPGSRVVHLSCNKHELTWLRLAAWRR